MPVPYPSHTAGPNVPLSVILDTTFLDEAFTLEMRNLFKEKLDNIMGEIKLQDVKDVDLLIKQAVWVVMMGPVGLMKPTTFFGSAECTIRGNFHGGRVTHTKWYNFLLLVKQFCVNHNMQLKGEMMLIYGELYPCDKVAQRNS